MITVEKAGGSPLDYDKNKPQYEQEALPARHANHPAFKSHMCLIG